CRSSRFAHPARQLSVLDDVDIDHWRFVHAEHLVRIEIALLDTPVLQCNLAIKRRCDSEDDGALNLGANCVRIDDDAAIDCTDNTPDTTRPLVRPLHFGNLCHVGAEDVLDGHAATGSFS